MKKIVICTATWLAQLVGHQTAEQEVTGSNPDQTTDQGVQITGEIMLAVIKTLSHKTW